MQDFLSDLDSWLNALEEETTSAGQRNILAKIQKGLITAQDIGDDKLVVVQSISDVIENRARILEHGAKNLDFDDDDDDNEPSYAASISNSTGVSGKQAGASQAGNARQGKRGNQGSTDDRGTEKQGKGIILRNSS